MEGIAQIVFLFFLSNLSYVQVFFHESPSSCSSQGEQGGKCHRKNSQRRRGNKNTGKNKQVEQGSEYQPL